MLNIWLLYGVIVVLCVCLAHSSFWLHRMNGLVARQIKAMQEQTEMMEVLNRAIAQQPAAVRDQLRDAMANLLIQRRRAHNDVLKEARQ